MSGWEKNVRRTAVYVPGEQPKEKGIIKLNTNECPYPPAPGVREQLQRMDYEDFRLYPAPDAAELTETLAEYYRVEPSQVFVGVGSDDVIAMAFLTFFNGDRPILFPDVTYSFYDVWAQVYRIPYIQCPLGDDMRIQAQDYMQENGGIIFPNPNAPTGILEPVSLIEDIVRQNPDVVVMIDEAYIDFGGRSCLELVDRYDNLLVIRTFSKSRAMAGMRIGFAIGSKKLIACLQSTKYAINSYTMNQPALTLGVAAVTDEAYFRKRIGQIISTREWVKEELRAMGFQFPDSYGNFVFATHPAVPAEVIFSRLKQQGIYVRHWQKPRIENYLRITIGTDQEMEALLKALKLIIKKGEIS